MIASDFIPWEKIRGTRVLVTGATGLVGSALVRILAAANEQRRLNIKIIAVGRNVKKMKRFTSNSNIELLKKDVCLPFDVSGAIDFIFHGAAMTRSAEMAVDPVGVIETSLSGTVNTLSLARAKHSQGMVFLSSVEVYGLTDSRLMTVNEDNLGHTDPLNPRSCYPESKRMCECLCACWHKQFGLPVKIARLAQTFGAGAPRSDSRVFTQFAESALAGRNITLHTAGKSRGNYCYISDSIAGLLLVLLKGAAGEAYNIVNPAASATIREMAELVAKTIGHNTVTVETVIPTNIQALGYSPDAVACLSAEKLKNLGWSPRYGLEDMYRRMVADWLSIPLEKK